MKKTIVKIGEVITCTTFFSKEDVALFGKVIKDTNPLHYDIEYCKKTVFKKPIIFGIMSGTLFSQLFGNNYPGSIYISQSLNFKNPIFLGEEIEARIRLIEQLKKEIFKFSTNIYKESRKILATEGEAVLKLPRDFFELRI